LGAYGPNPGRPDEFVKKIAQNVAQYIIVKINAPQNGWFFCNFQKTAQTKQSPFGRKNRPIWSPWPNPAKCEMMWCNKRCYKLHTTQAELDFPIQKLQSPQEGPQAQNVSELRLDPGSEI
jgi:hypothetical protein